MEIKLIRKLFILLGLSVFCLVGCSQNTIGEDLKVQKPSSIKERKATEDKIKEEIRRGNSLGNIANGGTAAEDKYYYYYSVQGKLYREHKESQNIEVILEEDCTNINVLDEQIIVMGSRNLYAINKENGDKTILLEAPCKDVQVINDWIYFINISEGRQIYRMKLDGSQFEQLNDKPSGRLNVIDNQIIYCLIDESEEVYDNFFVPCGEMYRMKEDGTQAEKLTTYNVSFINVVGEWIYYADVEDQMSLYKIRVDGTDKTKLSDSHAYFIHADERNIYYSDVSTGVYCIDSNYNKKLLDVQEGRYTQLNKVENRLYFFFEGGASSVGYIDLSTNRVHTFLDERIKDEDSIVNDKS